MHHTRSDLGLGVVAGVAFTALAVAILVLVATTIASAAMQQPTPLYGG